MAERIRLTDIAMALNTLNDLLGRNACPRNPQFCHVGPVYIRRMTGTYALWEPVWNSVTRQQNESFLAFAKTKRDLLYTIQTLAMGVRMEQKRMESVTGVSDSTPSELVNPLP